MELRKELEKLQSLKSINVEAFEKQCKFIVDTFTGDNDKKIIDEYFANMLKTSEKKIDSFIEESVKVQLSEISEMVSLAYISKRYFNRTRNWLYQRINRSIVNGRPARFTSEEVNTLNLALKDIGNKVGSTVIYA